eukprot:gene16869-biopygen6795
MKIRRRRRRLRKNANLTAMSQHCVRTPPQAWPAFAKSTSQLHCKAPKCAWVSIPTAIQPHKTSQMHRIRNATFDAVKSWSRRRRRRGNRIPGYVPLFPPFADWDSQALVRWGGRSRRLTNWDVSPPTLTKKSWSKESRVSTRLGNCGAKQQT